MYWPNLKSVAFPIPEIIGDTQKIWTVPGYAYAPFSPKFFMGNYSHGHCYTVIVLNKFEVRILTRSRDNSDCSFGWGANPQSWGRGGRRGCLPQISPCSPGSRWMAFALRRVKVLGYLSVQLVSKISNLCGPDPPTSRTDRQTDRRHVIAIPCFALKCIAR